MGHFNCECLLPKIFFIWIGLQLGIHVSSCAQSTVVIPDVHADEWRVQRFDTQDGLPHNTITAITQDQLGFVWIGTPNGLVRYDGYTFHPFVIPESAGSSSFIKTLYADELGMVWVGTQQDLYVVKSITLETVPITFEPTLSFGMQFITGDRQGNVYASNESGVYHCSLSTLLCELKPVMQNGSSIDTDYTVYISKPINDDLFGFAYTNKLVRFDASKESWQVLESNESLSETDLLDIGDGDFLHLRGDTIVARFNVLSNLLLPSVLIPNRQSKQIFSVANGRLYTWDSNIGSPVRMRLTKDTNAVLQNHVRSLYCGDKGSCWIGTLNGLARYSTLLSPFQSLSSSKTDISKMRRSEISAIENDRSHLIIGTIGGGVYRFIENQMMNELHSTSSKSAELIWDLKQTMSGDIWIGAENGLFKLPLNSNKYSAIAGPFTNTPQAVNQIEIVNDTTIFVASFAGLWLFDTKRNSWIRTLRPSENPDQRIVVQGILKEDENSFLFGTFTNEIFSWTSGDSLLTTEFRPPPHIPKSSEGYWALYRDTEGTLWAGSDAGLTIITADGSINHINSTDGLSGNIVYAILPDSSGRLWVSTDRGLSVIIPDNKNHEKSAIRSFHSADGLPIREFNRRAAFKTNDGQLWFGGIEGLTWFDPESIHLKSNTPAVLVYHAEIRGINGNRHLNAGKIESIELNPYENSLILEFGTIGSETQRANYRYMLSDVDFDTITVGINRSATYTNLMPGSYTFQVWASDEYGRWPKEGLMIPIHVRAAFWQTTSFMVLMIALVLVAIGYAYRLRFKRLLALERVRLSIAADLHDQVGSGLSSLAMMSELGTESPEKDQSTLLKTISSSARNMANELREIVWYTNPRFDNLNQVVERMRDLPYQLVPGSNLDLHFPTEIPQSPLSPDFRRDWMMSYREVLHNIAKHAKARNVRIELIIDHNRLELSIEDDGFGFDHSVKSKGMGLQNINDRIVRIRGTVKWISPSEKGTIVKISVPIP